MDGDSEHFIDRLKVFWKVIRKPEAKTNNDISEFDTMLAPVRRYRWKLGNALRLWRHSSPLVPMMKALPHLHFPEGFLLDYYQEGSTAGSSPALYVRKPQEPRLPNNPKECLGDSMPKVIYFDEAVRPDHTPDGAWELVLLDALGHQFNLVWHAGTSMIYILYDMDEFFSGEYMGNKKVCDFNVDNLSEAERKELLSWDISPKVTWEEDGALVDYCVFSPWYGFTKIQRKVQFKPEILLSEDTIIKKVPYDCGYIF
jgi:hypothetical protein